MSQENVDLVRKGFDALSVGGIEALLPFYPADVVMYSIAEWPDDPVYRGYEGARKLTAGWTDNFDEWGFDLKDTRPPPWRISLGALGHRLGPR
jgi:ketosteroid isomerase-like protein